MIFTQARRRPIMIKGERVGSAVLAQSRLSFLAAFFILAYALIGVRLLDLTVVQGYAHFAEEESGARELPIIAVRRGDIYDRNGFLVATTLKTPSLYADPKLVFNPQKAAQGVVQIFPDLDAQKVLQTLKADNRFGWLKRGITPEQQQAVLELGEPGLAFQYEYKRVYPQGPLFSHVLGYVDRDGLGLAGVERGYDDVLASGKDVYLSLDLRLQHVVKREVSRAIDEFTAKAGTGVIMDAQTGEVLAGVSLPDFDLNLSGSADDNARFNRLTLGVYELGSMFKIFSTAALLELHDVGMGYRFDATKPIKVGRFSINDYHAQKRIMTVPEVFMYSSNIGSAMMGQMVGGEALKNFYDDLGLLSPMNFGIREVGHPMVPSPWREVSTMTASYGHGIATTPLQMTTAVATIVNGGMSVSPSVVMGQKGDKGFKSDVRVISEETSEDMRKLLRLVVTEGTGKNAEAKGYMVGGKTGTAEKSVNGRYDRSKLISSFVGAFPMNDPRYVVMVMVDEPKGNKKSYGYATAGWVAAPAVSRIVTSTASVLGLPSDQYDESDDIGDDLLRFIDDPKKKHQGGKKLVSYTR